MIQNKIEQFTTKDYVLSEKLTWQTPRPTTTKNSLLI